MDERVDRFYELLDEADAHRSRREYEAAYTCAQGALEVLPCDGSIDRGEHEEMQNLAWTKRNSALDYWGREAKQPK